MPPKKSKKRKEPAPPAEHREDESGYDFKHDSEDAARERVRRIDERKLAQSTAVAERAGPCCALSFAVNVATADDPLRGLSAVASSSQTAVAPVDPATSKSAAAHSLSHAEWQQVCCVWPQVCQVYVSCRCRQLMRNWTKR